VGRLSAIGTCLGAPDARLLREILGASQGQGGRLSGSVTGDLSAIDLKQGRNFLATDVERERTALGIRAPGRRHTYPGADASESRSVHADLGNGRSQCSGIRVHR